MQWRAFALRFPVKSNSLENCWPGDLAWTTRVLSILLQITCRLYWTPTQWEQSCNNRGYLETQHYLFCQGLMTVGTKRWLFFFLSLLSQFCISWLFPRSSVLENLKLPYWRGRYNLYGFLYNSQEICLFKKKKCTLTYAILILYFLSYFPWINAPFCTVFWKSTVSVAGYNWRKQE